MKNEIYKLIMKYPLPSILGTLSMFAPFYVAILFFHTPRLYVLGTSGIIISAIMFHATAVCLWWFISYLSNDLMYKKINEQNPLENYFQTEKWQTNIVVGSLVSLIIAFASLLLCYFFDWSFKAFVIIVYALPITRLFILFFEWLSFYRTNKK